MTEADHFDAHSFDEWAQTYDQDVASQPVFPFAGYRHVLETAFEQAAAAPGMSILDLGTGTGNLALLFARRGCELWCTDFSEAMLAKARRKLPGAHFLLQDLQAPWPAELDRRFDRVVSAYVFHHFSLAGKVDLCKEILSQRITPGGRLLVADISFPNRGAMESFAKAVGNLWEEEPYWVANEALEALAAAGLHLDYTQVSACAGVYAFRA